MESIGSHLQNLYFIQNYMDNQYFLAADHIIAAFRNSIFRIHFHAGQLHPSFMAMFRMSAAFGHGLGYAIGLFILNPLFVLIIGLGRDRYQGSYYR